MTAAARELAYDIDERPPLAELLPLGLQHLVAMILSNVAVPLLIAGAIGVSARETALLVQMVLGSAFPNTSYSQNVGLVNFTGVASRHVTATTGGLLVLMGLVPKVGAFFATIPAR